MSYPQLALTGLLFATAGFVLFSLIGFRRNPALSRKRYLSAVLITAVALSVLTAIFDNLMIYSELFHYAQVSLSGKSIGLVPAEDFSYPLAGSLLLPALWISLERGRSQRRPDFLALVISSRPVSWINTAFPFGAAYLLTARELDWIMVVGVVYFLIPYNFAMYGINDVFDYSSDIANPRKGGIEGALLPRHLHRPTLWIAVLTNLPFLVLLGTTGSPAVWIALAVTAFAVVAYSMPGLRFKERPFLDSVTSSMHFVNPTVVGLLLAGAQFDGALLTLLVAFFLWGVAAHAFGAVQDIIPDREVGIHSIATVIGARATVRFAVVLWTAAGILMLGTGWPGSLAAFVVIPYLYICAPFWMSTDETSGETNRSWRRFIALNYFSGFLVTLLMIYQGVQP